MNDVVCYVTVIITNQIYALVVFSAQLINQAPPRIGWHSAKTKEHFVHCVRTYRVYSWGNENKLKIYTLYKSRQIDDTK